WAVHARRSFPTWCSWSIRSSMTQGSGSCKAPRSLARQGRRVRQSSARQWSGSRGRRRWLSLSQKTTASSSRPLRGRTWRDSSTKWRGALPRCWSSPNPLRGDRWLTRGRKNQSVCLTHPLSSRPLPIGRCLMGGINIWGGHR
ncbi:unnamed protein product, partial [Discosporangium mesarthrocarpum]